MKLKERLKESRKTSDDEVREKENKESIFIEKKDNVTVPKIKQPIKFTRIKPLDFDF